MRKMAVFLFSVKSDITVVFLDPDFLKDAKILTIRVHLVIGLFAWIFRTSWPKMGGWGKIGEEVLRYLLPTNSFSCLGVLSLCQFW